MSIISWPAGSRSTVGPTSTSTDRANSSAHIYNSVVQIQWVDTQHCGSSGGRRGGAHALSRGEKRKKGEKKETKQQTLKDHVVCKLQIRAKMKRKENIS